VNCDGTIPWNQKKKIYCGTFCKEQAKDIRWIRGTIIRGVYDDPDVVIARKTRIAHLNAGGYLSLNRRIPIQTRFAVMRKYNHKCATCGTKDVDGTHEVDHIEDSSNSIDNLQLLCIPCHRAKTMANIVSVEEDDPRREEIDIHVKELKERVFSPNALKLCDDYGNWPEIEARIREQVEGVSEYPLLRYWQNKGLAVGLVRGYPWHSHWMNFDQLVNRIFAVELNSISPGISKPAATNDSMMFPSRA
jgi:hypothetical protein